MNENLNESNNITPPVKQNVEFQNNFEVLPTENIEKNQTTIVEPPKKKKKGKVFIIILLIIGIIVGIVFGVKHFINKSNYFEDPFPDIDTLGKNNETKETKYFTEQLYEDLENGKITKDQYVLELAYSLYEPSKSSYDLTESGFVDFYYLYDAVEEYQNELSEDTIVYLYKKYTLSDYKWEFNEETTYNASSASANVYDAVAANDEYGNIFALNGVVLSSGGHFLVYYSDEGEYPTTKKQAEEVAEMLEKVIKTYKKEYNLNYIYEKRTLWDLDTEPLFYNKIKNFIEYHDIDVSYLETAMPVYILDIYSKTTDHYAYYSAMWDSLLKVIDKDTFMEYGLTAGLTAGITEGNTDRLTYAFPYIVIDAATIGTDDQNLSIAHELFHHYSNYICGDGKLVGCKSGGFTFETAACTAAIKAYNPKLPATLYNQFAGFLSNYINYGLPRLINKDNVSFGGYASYVFAYNYENVVPDGTNIIFQSMKHENALEYLYNNSKGKYGEALLKTSEKFLTLDYNNRALISKGEKSPYVTYPTNQGDINEQTQSVKVDAPPSSILNYYVDPIEFNENTQVIFYANNGYDYMKLQVFTKEEGNYKIIYTHDLDDEFVITMSDFSDYDEIAFAVVNTSLNDYQFNYAVDKRGVRTPTITPESLGLKKPDQSKRRTHTIMCYQVEDDTMFKEVYQVLINLDKDEKINNMMMKGTLEIKNYDPSNPAYKIAKNTVSGLLTGIKLTYKSKLKHVQMYTVEKENKYSILFNVTKDYDKAFKGSFYVDPNGKESIINAVESQGFVCE